MPARLIETLIARVYILASISFVLSLSPSLPASLAFPFHLRRFLSVLSRRLRRLSAVGPHLAPGDALSIDSECQSVRP